MRRTNAGGHSQSHFANIPATNKPRSTFDRSFGHKTTFDAGKLIPIFCDEVIPGDTWELKTTMFARLATLEVPYMDNAYCDVHYFFVPNRLVWDNWQAFMGENDTTTPVAPGDFVTPSVTSADGGGFPALSNYDYLGLPVGVDNVFVRNHLPVRALVKIWNDWYRDQNLQDAIVLDTGDGPDDQADFEALLPRNKRKDYFTSCLPEPQKGADVLLSLGTSAPVLAASGHLLSGSQSPMRFKQSVGGAEPAGNTGFGFSSGGQLSEAGAVSTTGTLLYPSNLYANLQAAVGPSVNSLRQAIVAQQLLELDARGGSRYVEMLLAHYGVVSPDFRLQRAELLAVSTVPINVNPVAQTSETASGTPQGTLAAFGTAAGRGGKFVHTFVEHGYVIGLASVRADLTYQQGMNRMWWKGADRFQFYHPMMANLGEQPVFNGELFAQGTSADSDVFGYQEAWAEYRYKPSMVTGQYRSSFAQSLDNWHLAQDFSVLPELDDVFIQEDPPFDRVVAVTSEPLFQADIHFSFRCTRLLPVYSVPGLERL